MQEHEKSGRGSQGVEWWNTFLPASERKRFVCRCPVQRRSEVTEKDCAVTGLYFGKCEGRVESRKNGDSESAPSGTE